LQLIAKARKTLKKVEKEQTIRKIEHKFEDCGAKLRVVYVLKIYDVL
jgi:hypothetical protein